MRFLLQTAAIAVASAMLWLGGSRMHEKQIPEETVVLQTVVTTTVATVPETTAAPVITDVIDTEGMDGQHIFLYDVQNQQMLFCNTDQTDTLYPASITKLFSAWVALQILPEDAVVTAGWELGLLQPGSSAAWIALDSRLTVEMLIEGMLLPSGNDAALVLAAAVGRHLLDNKKATASQAVARFVEEMNLAAKTLDLQNSHFENPDGYHASEHHSCPADLVKIAYLALEEPVIRRCMELQKDKVTFVSGETLVWENTNRLLNPESEYYCPDAVGMKTGYTGSAGYCLMAAFGERPLVVGIFGAQEPLTRYENAQALYNAWLQISEQPDIQMPLAHGAVEQ